VTFLRPEPVPPNEQGRLTRLKRYSVLDTARDPTFDRFVFTAAQLFRVPIAMITLVDEDRQWFKARVGIAVAETPREIAFCNQTITSDDLLVIEDTTLDSRFAADPLVRGAPFIRFYAGAPLITPDRQRIGTICILDRQPRTLLSNQIFQLQQLASSVVQQLELQTPTSASILPD
jgi:GAF domain-containing protein